LDGGSAAMLESLGQESPCVHAGEDVNVTLLVSKEI
jgi:hypothetical protein